MHIWKNYKLGMNRFKPFRRDTSLPHRRPRFHIPAPISNVLESPAESIAREPGNKRQTKSTRSSFTLRFQNSKFMIDKLGVPKTIIIKAMTNTQSIHDRTQRTTTSAEPEHDQLKGITGITPNETHSSQSDNNEYVLDRMMRIVEDKKRPRSCWTME